MISETKLDERFPNGQFFMHGFILPHNANRNANGNQPPEEKLANFMLI